MRSTTIILVASILLLITLIVFQLVQFTSLDIVNRNEFVVNRHLLSKFNTLSGHSFNEQVLNNNRPTLIMFFDPDCNDCNSMINKMLKYYSEFDSLNLLMITEANMTNINEFVESHNLKELSNLTILLDREEIMYKDYGIVSVPSFVLYNSKLELENKITEPFDFITLIVHVRKAINTESSENF